MTETGDIGKLAAILLAGWALVYGAAAIDGGAGGEALALIALVAAIAGAGSTGAAGTRGRVLWPLATWPLGYQASVEVIPRFSARYVDPWLAAVDLRALSWLGLHGLWSLDGPLEEVANALYVSYYLVIPLGLLWAWRRGDEAAERYGLALVAAFATCAAVWIALPSGGWHLGGSPTNAGFGPATGFAHWLYARNPHYAAAFPSAHVAIAVAATAVLVDLGASRAVALWPVGVAFATIYGQYHYSLDAVAGALVGLGAARGAMRVPARAPAVLGFLRTR